MCKFVRQNVNGDIKDALRRIRILEEKVAEINTLLKASISKTAIRFESIDKEIDDINRVLRTLAPKYTLTINPTPADAVVELNGEVKNSITAGYNTYVGIKVSKKGYKTYTEKYKLTQTETKDIVLEAEEFVNINPAYMEFSSDGESKNLQIESNTSWSID